MGAVAAIFLASLLGSAHCAAMCGPFVAFYSVGAGPGRRSGLHAAYSLGRLAAYATLGAVAGALGAGVESLGALAGVSRAAAVVAGVVMVLWGVDTLAARLGSRRGLLHPPAALQRTVQRIGQGLRSVSPAQRALLTGASTALLPCGWLYAFVAASGGTASPWLGALTMAVFWTGTLPVMVSLGLGLQRLAGPLRERLPLVTATAVVAIGLLTIAGRLEPPHLHAGSAPAAAHGSHR